MKCIYQSFAVFDCAYIEQFPFRGVRLNGVSGLVEWDLPVAYLIFWEKRLAKVEDIGAWYNDYVSAPHERIFLHPIEHPPCPLYLMV